MHRRWETLYRAMHSINFVPGTRTHLQVRPCRVQAGLLLLRIKPLLLMRPRGRQRAEQVGRAHENDVLAHGFSKPALPLLYPIHQLQQRLALHLTLPRKLGGVAQVRKLKGTQVELLHKQGLLMVLRHVAE